MTDTPRKDIDELVAELGSKSAVERRDARAALVRLGAAAVSPLMNALGDREQHVRWEAAKALAEIADPAAAERLIAALADKDTDVRWVVGSALIAIGREAVKPLLSRLTQSDLPDGVHAGAHHVLHDLAERQDLASLLQPVLKAYNEPEPSVAVPLAASKALKNFTA
jgi:HEAT repeat protein